MEIILHGGWVLFILRQMGQPNNGFHRGANVMAHAGKEFGLSLRRIFRLFRHFL